MFKSLSNYFQESYAELRERVTWPTWKELQAHAIVVLISTAIISMIVWVLDQGFGFVLEKVLY